MGPALATGDAASPTRASASAESLRCMIVGAVAIMGGARTKRRWRCRFAEGRGQLRLEFIACDGPFPALDTARMTS